MPVPFPRPFKCHKVDKAGPDVAMIKLQIGRLAMEHDQSSSQKYIKDIAE